MKKLPFQLLFSLLLLANAARAQSPYVGESVYYSRLQFAGPARTQGIAGANVALGADFGNLTSNPAGLGLFRQSEFHFTPGLGLGSADADGTGTSQNATKNSFHIASVGAVFTTRRADDDASSDWRGGSFALGFSRLADFNTSFRYNGTVADNRSFFQYLREPSYTGARGSNPNSDDYQKASADIKSQYQNGTYSSLDGLAFGTYLTDITGASHNNNLDSIYTRQRRGAIRQGEVVTSSGSVSQFDLGYGTSYKDRLFIGGAFGIVSSTRRVTRDFTEAEDSTSTYFSSLALHDEVKTTGTGINLRVGVIYRLNDALRLGASIQTPTYSAMSDSYSTSLTSNFSPAFPLYNSNNVQVGSATQTALSTAPGLYDYTQVTPFRTNGGAALTLGKYGFVSADVEYVGYGQTRYYNNANSANGTTYDFAAENQAIKTTYQNAINVRLGGEARLDIFRVRAGYAHYGDPYRNSTLDRAQEFYTAGVGFRQSNFYLDVAGVYTTYKQLYSPYSLASAKLPAPVISVNANRYTTTVTAGFTF